MKDEITNRKMDGLELIQMFNKKWYWRLDYRYADDSAGKYAESKTYNSDIEACEALVNNQIDWES